MLSVQQAAREHPDTIAVVVGEKTLSYAGLWHRVAPLCRWLRTSGLRRVGVIADRRLDTLLLLYALIETGTPAVLLHPRWTPNELSAAMATARPDFVAGLEFRADAPPPLQATPSAGTETATGAAAVDPDQDPASPLAVVFTSGSSGQPRGVVLSRRALLASARASAANLGWRDNDRWLLTISLAHIGGLSILTRALIGRRTVVVQQEGPFDAPGTVALVEKAGVTLLSVVPTLLARLLDAHPRLRPPPSLRAVLVGGGLTHPQLLAEARQRGWPVLTTYGLTEAASQVATQEPGSGPGSLGLVGSPLPGIEVRVVDGALEVKGDILFDGYLEQDSPNEAATSGPLTPRNGPRQDGWFSTEDEGRLDRDGNLLVFGRRGELIRSGGEQVHPAEVESVLLEAPEVAEACVFGVDDRHWGQCVYAAVVPNDSRPLSIESVDAHLCKRLAPWKRPTRIIALPDLPIGSNGKVDRTAVRNAAMARATTT